MYTAVAGSLHIGYVKNVQILYVDCRNLNRFQYLFGYQNTTD